LSPDATAVSQLLSQPVIGWERVTTQVKGRKKPKTVTTREAVQVRTWEIATVGAVLAAYVLIKDFPGFGFPEWKWPWEWDVPVPPIPWPGQ